MSQKRNGYDILLTSHINKTINQYHKENNKSISQGNTLSSRRFT